MRAAAALWVVVAALGCGPSEARLEAERVGHAIDALRNAPTHAPDGRMSLVEELERQPAVSAHAVEARDRCAKAYRRFEEAGALEARVRKGLAGPSPDPSLLTDLASAEAKLAESKAEMPLCEKAVSDMRIKAR